MLKPGDALEIVIDGIVSSLPSGPTNLYVHYFGLAGYRDGTFVLPVEKSPLVYHGANVGIGTASTDNRLEVNGNIESWEIT